MSAPLADKLARAREGGVDLAHVVEWLERGQWMACRPLFEWDGHRAGEKAIRLRVILNALPALLDVAEAAQECVRDPWGGGLTALDTALARLSEVLP